MKTYNHLKKAFIIASAIIVLGIGFIAAWQYVIPGYVATEVLGKLEDACYAGNSDKIMGLIYPQSPYYDSVKNDISGLHKVFNKFNKGFKITKTLHFFGSVPRDESQRREIILVHLSKIAKIDGKERWMKAELAKIDGKWKITYYYFQDYIDY